MRLLLKGLALAVTLTACAPSLEEEPAAPAVDLEAEDRAAYEATIERLRGELDDALAARADAEEALADARLGIGASEAGLTARLTQDLEACQGELDRYRDGLGRAVEELNERRPPPVSPQRPARQAPARDFGRVHTYTPRVVVHMLGVLVEWTFYSTRDSATEGMAVIRLMEDGREVAAERQPVTVGANANLESSVIFHLTPNPTGIYTAQVSLEDR